MAPRDTKADDFAFLVACLKHTSNLPKPDFDKVAAEVGADNGKACYHRHWSLLRKYGIGSSKATASPSTGNKRSRPKKNQVEIYDEADADAADDTPVKKSKKSPKKMMSAKMASEDTTAEELDEDEDQA